MCKQWKPNIATNSAYNTRPPGCSILFFLKTSSKLIFFSIGGSCPVRMWRVFHQVHCTCIRKCILTWQTDKNHRTKDDITPHHISSPHTALAPSDGFNGRHSSNFFHFQDWSASNFSLLNSHIIKYTSDENNGSHQNGIKKKQTRKKNVQQKIILSELTLKNVVQPVWRINTLSSIH